MTQDRITPCQSHPEQLLGGDMGQPRTSPRHIPQPEFIPAHAQRCWQLLLPSQRHSEELHWIDSHNSTGLCQAAQPQHPQQQALPKIALVVLEVRHWISHHDHPGHLYHTTAGADPEGVWVPVLSIALLPETLLACPLRCSQNPRTGAFSASQPHLQGSHFLPLA